MIFTDNAITHYVPLSDIPPAAIERGIKALADATTTLTPLDIARRVNVKNYLRSQLIEATATAAPPVVTAIDPAQAEQDWWFAELVKECRAGHVPQSRIDWFLSEAHRSQAELWAAVENQETPERGPAIPQARQPVRVFAKETKMSESEKVKVKAEWDAAIRAQLEAHPDWRRSRCVAAIEAENPALRSRYVESANS